jgi:lipoyl(octanoyl) transferase
MLDLEKRGRDIRRFVHALEDWIIAALGELGIAAHRAPGRIGIWVGEGASEAKIAALGIRVKRWVTLHGFSINLSPELSHFSGIVPCGISEFGVTSIASLGVKVDMAGLDAAIQRTFPAFLSSLAAADKVS